MQTTTPAKPRRLFLLWHDWTWWAWTITAVLLAIGLAGYPTAFLAAMALTTLQILAMLIREKSLAAFPVQLRLAYLALLAVAFIPIIRWLYWLPTLGTFALVLFGYCLMARMLALLPWNRTEPLSLNFLHRTLFSRPDISRLPAAGPNTGCAGGLCSITAQIKPKATPQHAEPRHALNG